MIKSVYHLIFERKHELNAENLTSAQSFPRLGTWSFCSSVPHFRESEVVMDIICLCNIYR